MSLRQKKTPLILQIWVWKWKKFFLSLLLFLWLWYEYIKSYDDAPFISTTKQDFFLQLHYLWFITAIPSSYIIIILEYIYNNTSCICIVSIKKIMLSALSHSNHVHPPKRNFKPVQTLPKSRNFEPDQPEMGQNQDQIQKNRTLNHSKPRYI